MACLVAAAGYFLPGGLVVPRRYQAPAVYDFGKGEGEMEKWENARKGKRPVPGKRKGDGEARRKARRAVEEALYAFLSSRGFVCNNLCGKTA